MRPLLLFILLPPFFLSCLYAAKAPTIKEAYNQSLEKMKASDWQGALDTLTLFTGVNKPEDAIIDFGPKFGWFWYHKGYCEDKLKLYPEAAKSFQNCFNDYPNSEKAKNKNTFRNYALYKWGDVLFAQGDYEQAKIRFEQFLKEKNPRTNPQDDKYPKGKLSINLSICQFKTGDIDEGIKSLESAVKNKNKFLTPPAAIFSGFDALLEESIKQKNEGIILDFLKKYRSDLQSDVFVASQYSKILLSRASQAIKADMQIVPLELLSLVPDTLEAINDLKAVAKSFEGSKITRPLRDGFIIISPPLVKELISKLENEARSKEPNEAISLSLSGYLWSNAGNNRAAYAAYKQLEERYPKSPNRESNLFSLIRTCQNIGKIGKAEQYGNTFVKTFPGSENAEEVKKVMITGLYFNGQYKEVLDLATAQLESLEESKPSEAHDANLFALGGSYYYLGRYQDADKYLSQHVSEYPESKFKDDAVFLEASNLTRMGQWEAAGQKLDAYLAANRETPSALYPYALFDRANSHFSLDELDSAMKKLGELEKFPSVPIIDAAYNLQGSIYYSLDDLGKAEEYYKKGLDKSKELGNKAAGEESLYSLILLLGDPERKGADRSSDAVKYYDEYWKSYAEKSPSQAQVAVSGFPAMQKVGRATEGLEKMKSVIARVAKLPGQPMLENLINSYRDSFLEVNNVDQLKEHFYNFDGIDAEDKEALALLRIALIGAYESEIKITQKNKDSNKVNTLQAGIKALFADLKNEFNPAVLTPYSLVKIGDYIREKTATPRESVPYFQEIIKRKNKEFKLKADFGLADVYASSNKPEEKKQAQTLLTGIYASDSAKNVDKERALFRLIELHISNEEWAEVNARSREYLDNKKFSKHRARTSYNYALSFDKQGKDADALQAYVKLNGSYLGVISVSAPSTKRMMELLWKRNTPQKESKDGSITMSDKQAAYNQGWKYVDLTRLNLNKFVPEDKVLWEETEALVKKFGESGEVKDMATQIEEKK